MISPRLSFEITTSPMDILPLRRFVHPAFPRHAFRPVLTTCLKQSVSIERQLGNRYPTGTKRGKKGTHGAGQTGTPENQHWSPTLRPFVFTRCFGLLLGLSTRTSLIIGLYVCSRQWWKLTYPNVLGRVSIIKIPSLPRHHRETTDWDT